VNLYLKEIASDACGISKNLTFHHCRGGHTFATTVTQARCVPIETVSKTFRDIKKIVHSNLRKSDLKK